MSKHETINKVVQINNTTIIEGLNKNSSKLAGLTPLGPDSPYAQVEKEFKTAILKAMKSSWKEQFPNAANFNTQFTIGFMLSKENLSPGMTAPCALTQIQQHLSDWNCITRDEFAQTIVNNIIDDLVNAGGTLAISTGSQPESASQNTDWLCLTIPFRAGTGNSSKTLIGYGFTAQSEVSL